jgi:hypothetical protein
MAIVTRYFSTAAAGAGNGTTWADRAVLFTGGAWSTVITAFDFSGADSLKCLIGPGTHTITVALASASFSVAAPTAANLLFFHGCDSSGNALTSPDEDWVSAQPPWDDSGLPVLATTTNIDTLNLALLFCRLIKFTASGRNARLLNTGSYNWCTVYQSTDNSAAAGVAAANISNSFVSMTGANYANAVSYSTQSVFNIRLQGVIGTGGNRYGLQNLGSSAITPVTGVTAIGFGGHGFINSSTNASQACAVHRCTFVNNGGSGINLPSTALQSAQYVIEDNLITGNGAYGLDAQSAARVLCLHNRFRDNTSGNAINLGNYPEFDSEETDTDDATEFVDAAGGDFRIKNTAATWGRGFGAGDEAVAGGGATRLINGGLIS